MKIEVGEAITLDNNKEYICVDTIIYNGNDYLYLISNFKPIEVMFAREEILNGEIEITEIEEQNLKLKLLELFQNNRR